MAPGAAEAAGCGGGGRRGTLCCTVVAGRAAGAAGRGDVSREDAPRCDDNGDRGRLPEEECIAVDTVLPKGSSPQTSVTCQRAPGQSADRPGPWMTTTAPAAGRSVGARRGVGRSVPGAWMGVGRSVGPVAAQRRGLLLQMPSRCRCSVAADRQRESLEPKHRSHKQANCLARSMQCRVLSAVSSKDLIMIQTRSCTRSI